MYAGGRARDLELPEATEYSLQLLLTVVLAGLCRPELDEAAYEGAEDRLLPLHGYGGGGAAPLGYRRRLPPIRGTGLGPLRGPAEPDEALL